MADSDDLNMGDSEEPQTEPTKKRSGLAALFPRLLKFIAIGIGALIFIITVAVITFNIMSRNGQNQTAVAEPASPYTGRREEFSMFTSIAMIRTRTKDATPYSVVVDMVLGYNVNDKNAQTELTSRLYELRDFTRGYFSGKYRAELLPENEARLKREIMEILNTQILSKSKVRIILFNQLDVMEM